MQKFINTKKIPKIKGGCYFVNNQIPFAETFLLSEFKETKHFESLHIDQLKFVKGKNKADVNVFWSITLRCAGKLTISLLKNNQVIDSTEIETMLFDQVIGNEISTIINIGDVINLKIESTDKAEYFTTSAFVVIKES